MKKYITALLLALLVALVLSESSYSQVNTFKVRPAVGDQLVKQFEATLLQASGITPGRAKSLIGGIAGIIGVVSGWLSLRIVKGAATKKKFALIALIFGAVAVLMGSLHLANSFAAEYGSGSGKAGAIVALVLGLVGAIFGSLVLKRTRADN